MPITTDERRKVARAIERLLDRQAREAGEIASAMTEEEISGALDHLRRSSLVGLAGVLRRYGERRLREGATTPAELAAATSRDFSTIRHKVEVLSSRDRRPARGSRPTHRLAVDPGEELEQ